MLYLLQVCITIVVLALKVGKFCLFLLVNFDTSLTVKLDTPVNSDRMLIKVPLPLSNIDSTK